MKQSNMNTIFQRMLQGTVWKNYMLLSTQWPSDLLHIVHSQQAKRRRRRPISRKQPDMNCSPAPTFLANSTLETYSQGDQSAGVVELHGCHGNAVSQQVRPPDMKAEDFFNQSDFTFMLEKARGERSDSMPE